MDNKILNGLEASRWLTSNVDKNTPSIDLCSAYMKLSSIIYFVDSFKGNGFKGPVRLLSRWRAGDLCSGASDLSVFEYCQSHGIDFYMKQDFHGKLYQVKPTGILIGSFNLTGSGFGLVDSPNDETGVPISCCIENELYIDNLFTAAKKVDQNLYTKIKKFLDQNNDKFTFDLDWPNDIKSLLVVTKKSDRYLVNEFFYKYYEHNNATLDDADLLHDLSLLGLSITDLTNIDAVSDKLKETIPYRWLKQSLLDNGGELYFGSLSEKLHNCLIDDPRPYRKDVKNLLKNLISWINFFDNQILIDRPSYSQRIRLLT
jgi:hypothetical protein